jgi:hypothetical protein
MRFLFPLLQEEVSIRSKGIKHIKPTSEVWTDAILRDVLKRHLGTCRPRIESGLETHELPHVPKFTKRRACNRCVRQKRACNTEQPCQTCLERDEPCNYSQTLSSSRSGPSQSSSCGVNHKVVKTFPGVDGSVGAIRTGIAEIPATSTESAIAPAGAAEPWDLWRPPDPASMDFSDFAWQDFHIPPPITQNPNEFPFSQAQGPAATFSFLANFTSTTGFVNSFDCGTIYQRQEVAHDNLAPDVSEETRVIPEDILRSEGTPSQQGVVHRASASTLQMGHIWGYVLSDDKYTAETNSLFDQQSQMKPHFTPNWLLGRNGTNREENVFNAAAAGISRKSASEIPSYNRWLSDPLALKTHQIVNRIKEVSMFKTRNSVVTSGWSSFLEEMCLQFFSPPNLRKFLNLYWAAWYPNWPVIHKPTFVVSEVHPILLASMALIGKIIIRLGLLQV